MVQLLYSIFITEMKQLLVLLLLSLAAGAQVKSHSPLAVYSKEWDNPKYKVCNTAAGATYLNDSEKMIIYVLNLARMNPKLFRKTVLPYATEIDQHTDTTEEDYYKSLVKQMDTMLPLPLFMPDSQVFAGAQCHAVSIGASGLVTHERQDEDCKKKQYCYGECCVFGLERPLGMIVSLLIDHGWESHGHRETLFRPYHHMGVAIAPHKEYRICAVIDIMY
jgi:hypothetical protein